MYCTSLSMHDPVHITVADKCIVIWSAVGSMVMLPESNLGKFNYGVKFSIQSPDKWHSISMDTTKKV
jgi:hypothetical protein